MLSVYEKENLNTFVNSEEDKLVFFNMNNIEICENISKIQEQVINPYDRLYDAITEDYLNTEAMIEGLETLKNLQDTYNKLQKNLNNTNTILNELQAGKSTVKTMFKKKEKEMSKLSTEKEEIEKNISNLGEIIKIATFNMQNTIENFKTISLDNYYAELSRIEGDTEKNGTIFDDLWETVVKDKNISEFN
jgi:chromosome segregation ATPase